MKRLTYELKKESDGGFGFIERGLFYKDGVEFARISKEMVKDLQIILDSEDDIITEIKAALRYELRDPSLHDELDELLEETFIKN